MDTQTGPNATELPHDLRQLLALIPEAAWLYDGQTLRILAANDRALDQYGYERDELLRLTLRDVRPPEDLDRLDELIQRQTAHRRVQARHLRKDGTRLCVEVDVFQLKEPSGIWLAILSEPAGDLEGYRRLEDVEARYQALVEQMPAVVYVRDCGPDGRLCYISPRVTDVLGYAPADCMRSPDHWIDIVHPDDRERVRAAIAASITTLSPLSIEYRCIAADGRVVWLRDETTLIRDAEGRAVAWHGVRDDISDRRAAEESLAHQAARLTALADASRAFAGAALDVDTVLATVTAQVAAHFGDDACVVRLLSPDGEWLDAAAIWSATPATRAAIGATLFSAPQRASEGLNGETIASGQARRIAFDRPEAIERTVFRPYWTLFERLAIGAVMIAPLRARGRVLGALSLIRERHRAAYSNDDLLLLEQLADRAALAIDNAQLFASVEQAGRRLNEALDVGLDAFAILVPEREADGTIVDFRFKHLNRRATRSLSRGPDDLAGTRLSAAFPPDEVAGLIGRYRAILERGTPEDVESAMTLPRRNARVWLHQHVAPFEGGLAISARDVTARRAAEDALRASEARYRTLVDNFPNGAVYLFDRERRITLAGGQGLGAQVDTLGDLTNSALPDLFEPDAVAWVRSLMDEALAGRAITHEVVRRERTFSVRAVPLTSADGEVSAGMAVAQDVTEQRRAEDALAQRAQQLTALATASRAFALAPLDVDAVLRTVAEQVALVLGDGCAVRLLDGQGGWLPASTAWHRDDEAERWLRRSLALTTQRAHEGLNGRVASTGEPLQMSIDARTALATGIHADFLPLFEQLGVRAIMIAPLRARGRTIGTISVMRDRPDTPFSHDELLLLENLSDRAAMAIDNARLFASAQQAESRLAATLDAGLDVFVMLEAHRDDGGRIVDFRVIHANQRAVGLVGLPRERIVGATIRDLYPADLVDDYLQRYASVVDSGDAREEEFEEFVPTWGGSVFVRHQLVPFPGGIAITVRDITERRRAELALRESEERFRGTFENAPIGMAVIDLHGRYQRVNPALSHWLGYDGDALRAAGPFPATHPDDIEPSREHLAALRTGTSRGYQLERRFVTASGETVWGLVTVGVVDDDAGRPAYGLLQVQDITARRRLEAQLLHQALHDALTGLPNRVLLLDRLEQALAHARRDGQLVAILFLDLDNFKVVNDSLGHRSGDALLVEVGRRLAMAVRESDTVSRFGGDEFVVLLPSVDERAEVEQVARRIGALLAEPVIVDDRTLTARGSIGIALSASNDDAAEDLLRQADIAMYRAKARGKNRFDVFEAEMQAQVIRRLDLEHELRHAIERDGLLVYYQPKIDLRHGSVVGLEALVRWPHRERGLLPPMEFIPLAEETGLIVPLGEWVLREACREVAGLQDCCGATSAVRLGVNLSARQLATPDLADRIGAILVAAGLAPGLLTVEITESVMMDDPDRALRTLHALDDLGVRLAIDDFGMGFSSLSRVKEFPLHELKIDRHFIADLGIDLGDTVVVTGIIGLAHALGMTVVAEGVETRDQLEHLRALDCDVAQGYYFARALPAAELRAWWSDFDAARQRGTDGEAADRLPLAPLSPRRRARALDSLAAADD